MFLRKGVLQEMKYNEAKYAKAPKYPFKLLGASILSATTAISAYFGSYSVVSALMLGGAVFAGWYLYYGFDVMKDKIEGYENDKSAQRIMSLLIKADADIKKIRECAKSVTSLEVYASMLKMADEFEKIVSHIRDEPDDYEYIRKYLVSYLDELKSMSETFIKLDAQQMSKEVEDEFSTTLKSATKKLQKEYKKLLDADLLDLDIKLSVMKKRLQSEE